MRAASGSMKRFLEIARSRGLAQADSAVKMVRSSAAIGARAAEEFVGDEIGLADAERQRQHHALAHAPQRLFHDFSDVIKHLRHGATLACSLKRVNANEPRQKPALDPMSLDAAHRLRISRALSFARAAAREARSSAMRSGSRRSASTTPRCRRAKNPRCATGTRTKRNSSSCCQGEVVLMTDAGEQVLTAGMCAGFPLGDGRPATDISW